MSWFIVIVFSLFIVHHRAEVPCETGRIVCPANTKCVANVGCVPQADNTTCQCPAQACAWPQECNCRGACALRKCSATQGCGKSVDPHDACQITICRQGQCVATLLACDNCDPKVGCKPGPRDVTTASSTGSTGTSSTTTTASNSGFEDDGFTGNTKTMGSNGWSTQDHTERRNHTIGFGITIGLVGLFFIGLAIYFGFISRQVY